MRFTPEVDLAEALQRVVRSAYGPLGRPTPAVGPSADQMSLPDLMAALRAAAGGVQRAAALLGIHRSNWTRASAGRVARPTWLPRARTELDRLRAAERAEREQVRLLRLEGVDDRLAARGGHLVIEAWIKDPSDRVRKRRINLSSYIRPATRRTILAAGGRGEWERAARVFTERGLWRDYEADGIEVESVTALEWR